MLVIGRSFHEEMVVAEDEITETGMIGITEGDMIEDGLTVEGITVEGITVEGITVEGITVEGITVEGITVEGITGETGTRIATGVENE